MYLVQSVGPEFSFKPNLAHISENNGWMFLFVDFFVCSDVWYFVLEPVFFLRNECQIYLDKNLGPELSFNLHQKKNFWNFQFVDFFLSSDVWYLILEPVFFFYDTNIRSI